MGKIGQIAAPLFLMAVGINLALSSKKRGAESRSHIIKRSIFLIILGLLFMNLWQADILHYIGVFILISYFLIPLSKYTRIAIVALILSTYGFFLNMVNYSSSWEVLAFKLANFWTLTGFFKNLLLTGFHPLLPWISFVLIGTVLGSYLLDSIKKKKEVKYSTAILLIGIILSSIGLALNFTKQKITFYPASISYMIFYIGMSMAIFSLSFYLLDAKNKFKKTKETISFIGSVSLSFYILHVIIGFGYFYLTSSLHSLNIYTLIPYMFFVLLVIYIICYISKIFLGDGPFEYLMKKVV
jgi:uncharacterized membrane protein